MKPVGLVRPASSDQRGVTLVELLVVVAILSIAIVTFATGLVTSQTATTDAKIRQEMHLALASFRSSLTSAVAGGYWRPPPAAGPGCDDAASAEFLQALDDEQLTENWDLPYQGDGMTFTVQEVRYWVGGPAFPVNGVISPGSFSGGCGSPDRYAQELVLEVRQTTMTKPVTGSVVIRKRL